ncbi:MAG: bifunctional diaminohydroxyphosphoribosylaminopyrimidine deaminase/5-amino-6-(5-phosphoribosylamino)uracil reductase RibD, partial [Oscillospiraceae bacterium]|nr:bifunctional diaminohydroxyphosphoribosylaminopyrimidine deaminase/5-amino-6-(5-phosphoribosylamino)uracil reductase RibD [Oscillospiraceae bacterium]
YMRRAIELAKGGIGFVNPNPLVGAVIVKDGKVIGEGFHERYGEPHAERNALKSCSESPTGADMYVTLEPCCHYGKNPPCTDAVIEAGIKCVYVGSFDPNPLVAGKGISILRSHGIEVTENFLRGECDALNDIFFHYITTKTPYVIMKTAVTADGKIAAATGDAKWITNELSRADTHETRKRVSAILVGVNTVISDDPMLNCRTENPSDPIRIVCDSSLRIPLDARVLKTAREIPTYIATVSEDKKKIAAIEKTGAHIIKASAKNNRVDLADLMNRLGSMSVDSVLIEGGGEINASALRVGIVNKVQVYIAPKIIGGDGKNAVAPIGVTLADEAVKLKNPRITRFGDDVLIEYEVE